MSVLQNSYAEIIRRHEIWRTSYAKREGLLVQVFAPPGANSRFSVVDFSGLSERDRENELRKFTDEQTREPFDFERGPLLRASLLCLSPEDHLLFIVAHLSIVDGVSVYQILPAELAAIYEAFSAGRESPLSELPVQFGDFAHWQRQQLSTRKWEGQADFWKKQLAERPILNWPRDIGQPPTAQRFRGVVRPFALSRELTEQLKYLSQREGVTLFVALLAGFTALLHRYTNQTDIIVGTLSPSGRQHPELQALMGHFINPVFLRLNPSPGKTFLDLLSHARGITAEAMMNDAVPMQTLTNQIAGPPNQGWNPFLTVGISLQPPMPRIAYDWTVTSMDAQSGGSPWDLYTAFIDGPDGLLGRVQYNPDRMRDSTVEGMWNDLRNLLDVAAFHPEKCLCDLPPATGAT